MGTSTPRNEGNCNYVVSCIVMKGRRLYLDYAAATPVSSQAKQAFLKALPHFGNPLSFHNEGTEAHALLEHARITIARLAEAKEDAVIFTSGATEANTLALLGAITRLLKSGKKGSELHVLYTPSSHASVREVMMEIASRGVAVEEISVLGGVIDTAKLRTQIRPETCLISVDSVCGETGTRFDTRSVRRMLDTEAGRPDILLHTDASQLPVIESFLKTRLGADLVVLDAQKVGGIRGIGVLLSHRRNMLSPVLFGGGQEDGLRPGTPSPALAEAFASALTLCDQERTKLTEKARFWRQVITDALGARVLVNEGVSQAPHILNLSFPGIDTEYLSALLDSRGVSVSVRSACDGDATRSSAVYAMTHDSERAGCTLRISFGHQTTMKDIRGFLGRLEPCLLLIDAQGASRHKN
jgi:cysteine desulfurase